MISILQNITHLRNGNAPALSIANTNQYRVVANELDGSKTAYYFSVPIYNQKTKKLIDLNFHRGKRTFFSEGSSARISFSDTIHMENDEGYCNIVLSSPLDWISENALAYCGGQIFNTTNGFACKIPLHNRKTFTIDIEISESHLPIRTNHNCFAYMADRYRPFMYCSCIGTLDEAGQIIAPAKLTYNVITDRKHCITFSPCSNEGKWLFFEINMYEEKLFYDTTVESRNPRINNAYGTVGFIGTSEEFGEQWLYSRPNFSKLQDVSTYRILKAVFHIPKLNVGSEGLSAHKLAHRFCSLTSTWENKTPGSILSTSATPSNCYFDIDLLGFLTDYRGKLTTVEGIIIKPNKKAGSFSAISTGDCCYAPQILEIRYI